MIPSNRITVNNSGYHVVVKDGKIRVISVIAQGPVGPPGAGTAYLHTQAVPANTWTINHNLGAQPKSVSLISVGGLNVDGSWIHLNTNQIQVNLNVARAGFAYII